MVRRSGAAMLLNIEKKRKRNDMVEVKRYIVIQVRKIIHATDDRKEAIKVAKDRQETFTFVDVYDLLTRTNIYEWSY